jgi:hypothetical protein
MRAAFMLSTGRSGTGTFAYLLQQSSNFRAFHAPYPELIEEAFEVQQGSLRASDCIQPKIDSINHLRKGYESRIYAETNHKLSLFAKELDRIFEAKFFWVIRDPFEYVNSGINRKWYTGSGGIWDAYRERPRSGWAPGTSQVQKIAWQWCEINAKIEEISNNLNNIRVFHFSDLRSDMELVHDLLRWLGADDISQKAVKDIWDMRINVGRYSAKRDENTGDHIFGEINKHKTIQNDFDKNLVMDVISVEWPSKLSERYIV